MEIDSLILYKDSIVLLQGKTGCDLFSERANYLKWKKTPKELDKMGQAAMDKDALLL